MRRCRPWCVAARRSSLACSTRTRCSPSNPSPKPDPSPDPGPSSNPSPNPNQVLSFRSRCASFVLLIQMSDEMWGFAPDGELYHEKAVTFLRALFQRWTLNRTPTLALSPTLTLTLTLTQGGPSWA